MDRKTTANITEELINSTPQVTLQDLDNLKQSIVTELYELHWKTNTEKARLFIIELISVIGFLLTFYSVYKSETDISNISTPKMGCGENDLRLIESYSINKKHYCPIKI